MGLTPEFWRGKRVFLTGHTGFKGSWLSLWLRSLGAEVSGYAFQAPRPGLFEAARIADEMRSTIGDIRDLAGLLAAMKECRPEIVIHMAAQPLVKQSYSDPVDTYSTNVMGTVNLLEAARHVPNLRVVVNVTSDKCYENQERLSGYCEHEPMGGYDPYSSSKGCSELVTAAFRSSFFNPGDYARHGVAVASARAGNVIGGGDWSKDRLIPDTMNALLQGRPVIIRSPKAIRPWQHVLEPLGGYLVLAQRLFEHGPEFAEAWNFGPSEDGAQTVEWIVDYLTRLWGNGASWELDRDVHPHEATYLTLDISKARARLGWEPAINLEQSLQLTTDWYREFSNHGDMQRFTLQQIHNHSTASGIST